MNTRTSRALVIAVALNVILAAALLFLWWRSRHATAPESAKQGSSQMTAAASPPMNSPPDGTGNSSQPEAANNDPVLAPVQLTPQRLQSIGVKLGTARMKAVSNEVRVTGNVEINERQLATVQLRFPGWIHQVFVDATYDYVRKGQPLFTIYSPDLVTTEQEYLLARKNQQELKQSLVDGVAASADTLVSAARERLQQWEVPQSEIAKIESTGKPITDLTINSPVSGYITERNALPNLYVQPESKLYAVAGLSTVWIYAQIFQTDIGRIKRGDPATVTVDSYPGKTFKGKVDSILPQMDMSTRTARVRLVFPNPGLLLKPGMFVNVQLKTPAGKGVTIPAASVFHAGSRNLVFVSKGEGNFEPREVELGSRMGDEVVVLKGLKPGESLVTSANFLIDSEAQLQAAAGAFAPPPPGAGAAAAMNRPEGAPQANIELTTDPSPPKKGSNVFRVKLTGANGSPIAGAQVSVTFFMPAMPAMGMSAMKTNADLSNKGNGLYEGKGELGSGGTWQVSIVARQNGTVIASKQLSVNATGGM
ncbi:MAG: efflux transporter, family, subunit [Candidatus Angelobacter sp.]|jgi:Cu(I)/Ag(I) efflux system membrane fusion protein/cobalt-zinc-cadmium efflux system membrane fusion protein|nr:efflux transporter, family, subunit [Candidatus Angelobacter sp.]